MKILVAILLLLLSSIAWGQEVTGNDQTGYYSKPYYAWEHQNDSGYALPLPPSRQAIHFIAVRAFKDSLVVWWDEYVKVSNGDSIRRILESPYWRWNEDQKRYLPLTRDTMWTHTYPDFPGFINFLRRRK